MLRLPATSRSATVALITVGALLVALVAPVAAAAAQAVIGKVVSVRQSGDGVRIRGWAYDADLDGPVPVRIRIDGRTAGVTLANKPSQNLAKQHPDWGANRAFIAAFDQPAGPHTVCADAWDYPAKKVRVQFGCKRVTVKHDPFGALERVSQSPGYLTLTGWTIDPNQPTAALRVSVLLDGRTAATGTANEPRPDVQQAHPSAGANHGFTLRAPVTEGRHEVCLRVRNRGPGSAKVVSLACARKAVSFSPGGRIGFVHQRAGGKVRVVGALTDPDTRSAIQGELSSAGVTLGTFTADASTAAGHGFDVTVGLPRSQWAPGKRKICLVGLNYGAFGRDRIVACTRKSLNYNPTSVLRKVTQKSPGVRVLGYSVDPDTTDPVDVRVSVDGTVVNTVAANRPGGPRPGHRFTAVVPASNGTHKVCVAGINLGAGGGRAKAACKTVSLNFNPVGDFEALTRASDRGPVHVTGWAFDPDRTTPIQVSVSVDGGQPTIVDARKTRGDVERTHPGVGRAHGFDAVVPADDLEHTVCITALNVGGGNGDTSLGCRIVIAVHPLPPSTVTDVTAQAGYGGAVVTWTPPASDGGAPWTSYTITAAPGGKRVRAGAGSTTATVYGLKPSTKYRFRVVANNVAGSSTVAVSNWSKTQAAPPAQTTPAPISTSRYIRNITGASTSDRSKLFKAGRADAISNPSGHGYLQLIHLGGQDESRGGNILSASTKFVTYAEIVANLKRYVDGYASRQRPSAPAVIAISTNSDIDVTRSAGASWANKVIDPLVTYTRKYPGITISGSNDIEPGFRASYAAAKAWVRGYLASTAAPFVFGGSADGCSGYAARSRCNNGWTMSGLYYLSAGAAPTRILGLPQIYNTTMARQWRYISLTGVKLSKPRINFAGPLTEWTACRQAQSCGSLSGTTAWRQMWNQLRAEPSLRVRSLPYSTDLRIDW